MAGADILKVAPQRYASTVHIPETSLAKKLKGIAQIHLADLGSRIFYCDHLGFDTHANQLPVHATLWNDVSQAIAAFLADLREHQAAGQRAGVPVHRVRGGGCAITARAPTMGPGGGLCAGGGGEGGSTGVPLAQGARPDAGGFGADHGLPGGVRHHSGGLAARRRQAHRQGHVRTPTLPLS